MRRFMKRCARSVPISHLSQFARRSLATIAGELGM
jgi:hypothetical protein